MNKENYPTWLVPLDIAQELKAIGFNEGSPFIIYPNDDEVVISGVTNIDEDGVGEICVDLVVTQCYAFNKCNFQTIPTWEQVFEWFREKGFNAWIEYQTLYENYIPKLAVREVFIYIKNNKGYKTYEEAREALVVTLIQTYKREQL